MHEVAPAAHGRGRELRRGHNDGALLAACGDQCGRTAQLGAEQQRCEVRPPGGGFDMNSDTTELAAGRRREEEGECRAGFLAERSQGTR